LNEQACRVAREEEGYGPAVRERWRHRQIAEHLGVSRQRVQQLFAAGRLPAAAGEDTVGRYWRPSDIRRWAMTWAKERSWRQPSVHESDGQRT
jgi:hypothetical protein